MSESGGTMRARHAAGWRALLASLLLALAAGSPPGIAAGEGAPRNADGSFRNTYPHAEKPGAWDFLSWQVERWSRAGSSGGEVPAAIPVVATDPAVLRDPAHNPSLTWIGHSTVLLRLAGKNVLVDPVFSERASPVAFAGPRRIVALPIDIPDLPPIDVVLITHNHYDHLDEASVLRLARRPEGAPRFLVPLGLKAWFTDAGIAGVDEYDWWQSVDDGALRYTFVPTQHWSRRNGFDTNRTLWGGWVIEGAGRRLIHLGDTGYSRDARDVGERLGPFDLALIPIGAYAPRWFMQVMHADPSEAIRIRADLRAERAIGIHWGTFAPLGDEPPDEPPRLLALERARVGLARDRFDVMAIGETRSLR